MVEFVHPEKTIDMERGDGIIRWSPTRTRDEFLTINLMHRKLALHKATGNIQPGGGKENFQYEDISRHTDFPSFGAYDWSPGVPGHDLPGLLAVGSRGGDVKLLRIDDDSSDSLNLPTKTNRNVHAVAFNGAGSMLAVGLDRVRNDHCLHIWDINQRLSGWDSTKKGLQGLPDYAEPIIKLEANTPISSVRWFEDQPMTLVVGVKNQMMKIVDLRDPNTAVAQFITKCTNNLAINHKDPNYFASSSLDHPGVMVWDRRAASLRACSRTYLDIIEANEMPQGCVLKLNRVIDPGENTHIRSIRYCRDHSSLMGILSSAGQLTLVSTEKERLDPNTDDIISGSLELLQVEKTHDIAWPYFKRDFEGSPEERIVSFDWVPIRSGFHQPRVIARRANAQAEIILKPFGMQKLLTDLLDFSGKSQHPSKGTVPKLADPEQAKDIVKPILEVPAKEALTVKNNKPPPASASALSESAPSDTPAATIKLPTRLKMSLKTKSCDAQDVTEVPARKTQLSPIQSSREEHERLLKRISTGKIHDLNMPDRVEKLLLDRIRRKYLFDWKRNQRILMDDPWLQDVWTWVGGAEEAVALGDMISGHLDLAYMGVHGIWNNDLGDEWQKRLIDPDYVEVPGEEEWTEALEELNTRCGRGFFDQEESVKTSRPHHRLMCLVICGWGKSDEELEQDLLGLESKGLYSKAAAWALFEKKGQRAVTALQRGGKNLLFMGLALGLTLKTGQALTKEDWDYSTSDLSDIKDDPYLKAIFTVISTGDMKSIVNETSLPLRDRVGVALHNLDDTELPNWLNRQTTEAIEVGDIEGLVLTGITKPFLDLLQKYIERFGDYQTATLLIHFAAPLYITDSRVDELRLKYQQLHNTNRLFVQRCHYDVGSTKLSRNRQGISEIKPAPRQVTLRCTHCDSQFANDLDNTAMEPKVVSDINFSSSRNPLQSSKSNAGISCPKCGKHLPRCGICLLTLGMPRSDRDIAVMGGQGLASLKNFMSFCMKCDHAFHADHARGWFRVHNECPIPECHCQCNVDGGGMAGMEREEGAGLKNEEAK